MESSVCLIGFSTRVHTCRSVYGMAGLANMLSVEALYDVSLLNCRPSIVAAALLYAERRVRGAIPFWPSMLAKLTG